MFFDPKCFSLILAVDILVYGSIEGDVPQPDFCPHGKRGCFVMKLFGIKQA